MLVQLIMAKLKISFFSLQTNHEMYRVVVTSGFLSPRSSLIWISGATNVGSADDRGHIYGNRKSPRIEQFRTHKTSSNLSICCFRLSVMHKYGRVCSSLVHWRAGKHKNIKIMEWYLLKAKHSVERSRHTQTVRALAICRIPLCGGQWNPLPKNEDGSHGNNLPSLYEIGAEEFTGHSLVFQSSRSQLKLG